MDNQSRISAWAERAGAAAALPRSVKGSFLAAPQVPEHELVSCIGRGAYGEVWLARNVIGGWRAVKVVYRRAFEHERPYEREFEGIRKFEPISRTHPSQLNILQVGRNDEGGYFYYVMELADGVDEDRVGFAAPGGKPVPEHPRGAARLEPETYTPRTLKQELCCRGRLPFEECLKLGLSLTTALEHLHEHGLVHRDIKPSNIIFVNGTPKLADIGLVAMMDATMSFVGTSGFLPPEGPGTPQADLYSLGKVFYEMAMGRDRQEFPKLPADLAECEDPTRLLELNAVILKACHRDPRQRYRSAKELAADLLLLQRGHSVRRLRTVERRLAIVTKAVAVVSVMLLLAAALYWNAVREQRATARQLYVADMNRAQQAWEGGNITLARELLDMHLRRQPDMLGFEWRLLARLCQESDTSLTLRSHTGTVWNVAFSGDGGTLATASGDNTVKLWSTSNGRLLRTLKGHTDYVHAVAFSPDAPLLASGSRDFSIKLWDSETGDALDTLNGHTNAVRALAFSPDRKSLASAGEDETIRWWNLARKQEVARSLAGFSLEQLTFSPDGGTLAACGSDNRVHIWNCSSYQEEPGPPELHHAQVLSVAYSPDGRILATAGYDGTIRLWDLSQRRELAVLGSGAPVRCVAFAPGNRFLAAATEDGLIRFWDLARHQVLTTLRGHTANVRGLAFSPDGHQLATGDEDAVAKLWNVPAEPGLETALKHSGIVNSFAFSPDGRRLATIDSGIDTLRLWDTSTQQPIASVHAATNSVWCVAFAPEATILVTGGVDGTIRLWHATNLSQLTVLRGHTGGIDRVAFSPGGEYIASGSRDCTAKVWQRATGREAATLPSAAGVVRVVAFAPDGKILATGCGNGHVLLWEVGSFRKIASLEGHNGEVRALAFSPDGHTLASGGADRIVRLWDVRNGKALGTLAGHSAMLSSLAFSLHSRTLVSGSWDSTVKLWNLRLLREVSTLRAHSGQVTQVSFSPDGHTLASSSSDGIRLWPAVPDIRTAVLKSSGVSP